MLLLVVVVVRVVASEVAWTLPFVDVPDAPSSSQKLLLSFAPLIFAAGRVQIEKMAKKVKFLPFFGG